jgi:hypothetical protein
MKTYGKYHSWPGHKMEAIDQIVEAPAALSPGEEPPVPIG